MKKRVTLLVIALLCFALTVAVLLRRRDTEPEYNGHPLHYWILALFGQTHGPGRQTTIDTIAKIDTNAIPYLIKWIQFEPAGWRSTLARRVATLPPQALFSHLATWIYNPRRRQLADGVPVAFHRLGPSAVPAIDDLVRMMNNPAAPQTACRATLALGGIATNSLPAMLKVAQNPQHPCQGVAINILHVQWGIQPRAAPTTTNWIIQHSAPP